MLKLLKEYYNRIINYNTLKTTNINLSKLILELRESLRSSEDKVLFLKKEVKTLNNSLIAKEESLLSCRDDVIKEYFYSKYPKRSSFVWNDISVKNFATSKGSKAPVIEGTDNDDIAKQALLWVAKNISYVSDPEQWSKPDNWSFANDTLKTKIGDCEDGAILLYHILRNSGIPSWRIRLNAGLVKGGGHAYITYCKESNNQWVILDWCYWFKESKNLYNYWHKASKYYGLWFSWNEDYVWIEPEKL